MANANLVELITRPVASAMVPVDAQVKAQQTGIIAMKNVQESGGLATSEVWMF